MLLVIGTAFALNILLDIPIWAGVLLAGLNTLLLLALQRYGVSNLSILQGLLCTHLKIHAWSYVTKIITC